MSTKELVLTSCTEQNLPKQLADILEVESTVKWGETFIDFENGIGNGQIKTISFDWGITFISCDLNFSQTTQLSMRFEEQTPIDFIFINSGTVEFQTETLPKTTLNSFQNIIIRYIANTDNIYSFKKNQNVEMTFIRIVPQKYLHKKTIMSNFSMSVSEYFLIRPPMNYTIILGATIFVSPIRSKK